MDLISRKAAIEAVKIEIPESCNPEERYGIIYARVEARRNIGELPSVNAVPLDKLCEFLGEAVTTPCSLLDIGCPYNEATREDCDSCRAREAWKITLSKWMEEQDAAD